MFKISAIFFILFSSFAVTAGYAAAEIKLRDPLPLTGGLQRWEKEFSLTYKLKKRSNPKISNYAECRTSQELPSLVLCFFDTKINMNRALVRASLFSEGSSDIVPNQVLALSDTRFKKYATMISGHDLRGKTISDFISAASVSCKQNSELCLSDQETEFFQSLDQIVGDSTDFALAGFSRFADESYGSIASHEIMHGQYFLSQQYRDAVKSFWQSKVIDSDRTKMTKELSPLYDAKNEELIENEFQAYLLETHVPKMNTAAHDLLYEFGNIYRPLLIQHLKDNGINLIQIDYGISHSDFDSVIQKVTSFYRGTIENLGMRLWVSSRWDDLGLFEGSTKWDPDWSISIPGGWARNEFMTPDAFALMACHEFGHLIGGAPLYSSQSGGVSVLSPASTEGQSDYWAALKCFRSVYAKSDSYDTQETNLVDPYAQTLCEINFQNDGDRKVCIRGMVAAQDLADAWAASISAESADQLDLTTPDTKVVTALNESYASIQCRLETFAAGFLCSQPTTSSTSATDKTVGACNGGDFTSGSRPACWYH
jgi:hypothetical protein